MPAILFSLASLERRRYEVNLFQTHASDSHNAISSYDAAFGNEAHWRNTTAAQVELQVFISSAAQFLLVLC
jgi:hypothetical protein